MKFPDNKEQRQAGMAAMRARMLAAHQRQLAKCKKPEDAALQQQMIDTIKAAQKKYGEA